MNRSLVTASILTAPPLTAFFAALLLLGCSGTIGTTEYEDPNGPGDTGAPALWPNSPPFPAPSCGDGVCSLSRGEDAASCGADCGVDCGDLTCQPGESPQGCPTDCEVPLSY